MEEGAELDKQSGNAGGSVLLETSFQMLPHIFLDGPISQVYPLTWFYAGHTPPPTFDLCLMINPLLERKKESICPRRLEIDRSRNGLKKGESTTVDEFSPKFSCLLIVDWNFLVVQISSS